MKVRALKKFESIIDGAIGRKRREGEVWEVDQERAEHLIRHGVAELVELDPVEVSEPAKEPEPEKPKRGRKKKA